MRLELELVEQRLKAVHKVPDGVTATDVAKRNGVTRQTAHTWLRRYADSGSLARWTKPPSPKAALSDDPGGRSSDRRDEAHPIAPASDLESRISEPTPKAANERP